MSEQNRYQILSKYKNEREWTGWFDDGVWPGDTWQDAIHNFLQGSRSLLDPEYGDTSEHVMSENQSEDGKSGIMKIIYTADGPFMYAREENVKATLIEDD